MGKHLVPVVMGIIAGVSGLGYEGKLDGMSQLLDSGPNPGDRSTQIEVGAPTTKINHLAAFAVGKISGTVTVEGDYNQVRFGPIPNCEVHLEMELPFVAEPIIELKDLDITTSAPDAAGKFDVDVQVTGDIKVLNPRTLLYKPVVKLDEGWTNICTDGPYTNLIQSMWNIGGLATDTAAQCMVDSVKTQTVTDANGNAIESDPSKALHQIYDDDLRVDLQALYPNAKSITITYPPADPNFDITQTPTYHALDKAITDTEDDDYEVRADPVSTCTFESLQLDVATTSGA